MSTTIITFGCQYGLAGNQWGKEIHPSGYPVSGDGWCEITGCTGGQARGIAHALFSGHWAFEYDSETFFTKDTGNLFPAGCQMRVKVETAGGGNND